MRTPVVGIRREDKNRWESRAPLTPADTAELRRQHSIEFVVQPSELRVFRESEYAAAGCTISEDLSRCGLVLGVKEMPLGFFRSGQAYAFFAHVLKGQPHNMGMLARMMELGCHLIDYEKIVDEAGRRLVLFGRFAGLAGMIDTLAGLGRRLELNGQPTPLTCIRQALEYADTQAAKSAITGVGREIAATGLSESLVPLTFGVVGYGNVAKGAVEILTALGAVEVQPSELSGLRQHADPRKLYYAVFREEHTVMPREPGRRFDLEDYYRRPEEYQPAFEKYLEHLVVLVNCIYWDRRYPRLVTKEWLRRAWQAPERPRLVIIGDISCDVHGAIEATVKTTNPGSPFFVYEPKTDNVRDGIEGDGPVILAVDNLPCELPRDSSVEFGRALSPFVPALAQTDFTRPYESLMLPVPLRRALILHQGRLTPEYTYVQRFLSGKE